jgi:hypothetical protein
MGPSLSRLRGRGVIGIDITRTAQRVPILSRTVSAARIVGWPYMFFGMGIDRTRTLSAQGRRVAGH